MPRPRSDAAIDRILRDSAEEVVARVAPVLTRLLGEMVERQLREDARAGRFARGRGRARRRRGAEMTRWVADRRARRVPKFVIEATGLDTKKKIVAKYGDGASFERGKALPRAKG
ncbi:MAG TPA: hypothetical protein VLS93_03910 [Anaeromyxobacteraceae bacterium]|nr:hypothetical protein [Anaeromyxobacteraceae bacterium]